MHTGYEVDIENLRQVQTGGDAVGGRGQVELVESAGMMPVPAGGQTGHEQEGRQDRGCNNDFSLAVASDTCWISIALAPLKRSATMINHTICFGIYSHLFQ